MVIDTILAKHVVIYCSAVLYAGRMRLKLSNLF